MSNSYVTSYWRNPKQQQNNQKLIVQAVQQNADAKFGPKQSLQKAIKYVYTTLFTESNRGDSFLLHFLWMENYHHNYIIVFLSKDPLYMWKRPQNPLLLAVGVAKIIILIILPPLCFICVFPWHRPLGLLLAKGGHGIFNVRNDLSVRFGSPFSPKIVVYGHCLVTWATQLMKH